MKRAANATLIAVLCLCGLVDGVYGQNGPRPIRWRAEADGTIPRGQQKENAADVLAAADNRHLVLQFNQIPDPKEKARLAGQGITLLRYLGDNAWFAKVSRGDRAKAAANRAGLAAALRIERDWKLHPRLIRGDIPAYARIPAAAQNIEDGRKNGNNGKSKSETADLLALYLIFQADVDLDKSGTAIIANHGGSVRSLLRSINGAVIWLPADRLQALAEEDAVEWIEPPLPPLDVNNDSSRTAVQADLVQVAPYSLSGSGIKVMVYDGGTAMSNHVDMSQRLLVCDNSNRSEHASHVAGTIGGNGYASGGLYAGMAPQVLMYSFGFEYDGTGQFLYSNPGDLESDYAKAVSTYGAMLANNSIGTNVALNGYSCDWEGDYGVTDMMIDSIVRGSLGAPMRVIWAAGNERGSGRCGVEYRTTAPPANAKNHIAVGAINSNDLSMTNFSSWGPTDDGRIKPDICAPGCQSGGDNGVTSTVSTGYGVLCGTSMAAPAVTGASALLLQDWLTQFPSEPLPPNALLKALFIHNAQDLGQVGPDYKFGFGAVRTLETIDFIRSSRFTQGTMEHGQELRYFVPVTAAGAPLKVTLAWDDPPGAVNTVPELVNDLDLRLISPSGAMVYPWTLNPANPALPAVRTQPDHRNNVEQVVVDAAEVGAWTIIIHGYSIPSGPQAFSICASPGLSMCSSAGFITLQSARYGCESSITLRVKDCDLDTDPETVQTIAVTVNSPSEPPGETVLLTENASASATFEGSLPSSTVNSAGVLQVAHGDTITATYVDADDGEGNFDVVTAATAVTDCEPPAVSNVSVAMIAASSASVLVNSNEPCLARVRYGTSCAATNLVVENRQYLTEHAIALNNLTKGTDYYFVVEVDDEAGNRATLNNGSCYQFRTLELQNFFTQLFASNDFDLNGAALTLVPDDNSLDRYSACKESIVTLPVSIAGATALPLNDDTYCLQTLADGKTFPLYGVHYSSMYIASNGFITFNSGDNDYSESIADHFSQPRISVLFDDFTPTNGSVKWQQFTDRAVVTWNAVPEYGTSNSNTFQTVLHFDGTIEMAWLGVAAKDGLVGISQGLGQPTEFEQTDLSSTLICVGPPEKAFWPTPPDLMPDASVVNALSWQRGRRATSHEVYFGLSPAELALQSTQTQLSFALPTLANNQTYYWRIDELNSYGRTTGHLWSFTTRELKPDLDSDGDVDMTDYADIQLCLSGTNVPQNLPECQKAKMDQDEDVDSDDVELFGACLSGADTPALGSCMP